MGGLVIVKRPYRISVAEIDGLVIQGILRVCRAQIDNLFGRIRFKIAFGHRARRHWQDQKKRQKNKDHFDSHDETSLFWIFYRRSYNTENTPIIPGKKHHIPLIEIASLSQP
jgi:hypothetical protein